MALVDFQAIDRLSVAAKAGDQNAADRLMELSYKWVEFIIRDNSWFAPAGTEYQDFVQEGVIGAFQALEDWRPDEQPFTVFGRLAIERWLITQFIAAGRLKRKALNEAISLNAPAHRDKHGQEEADGGDRLSTWVLPDPSGLSVNPADAIVGDDSSELLEEFRAEMTDLERDLMERCLINGETYQQAARAMGRHAKSVDNALQRVRRKIVRMASRLARDRRFSPETQAALVRTAALASQGRRKVTDEELRATLPVELLRPSGLQKFSREHHQWILPPDRLLIEYPNIHDYAQEEPKRSILALFLERRTWKEIAGTTGHTISACKHHMRRLCEKAAREQGIRRKAVPKETPLFQRVRQLWLKGLHIQEIVDALSHVASPEQVSYALNSVRQRHSRSRLRDVPGQVETRRIPVVRLNRIPSLLTKAKPLLIPEHMATLKLYMQGYSHAEIAERRGIAHSSVQKNDMPVIRTALRDVPGFEWLYDPTHKERQVRLLAIEALGLTVEQALARVPEHHRTLFELYLAGLSHAQIDTRLGLDPGKAQKYLHHCRSCMRRPDDFRHAMRRHNTTERDAAKRIRKDPATYERFQKFGRMLPPDRQRLMEMYYKGMSTGAIAEAFGAPVNSTGRGRMWARIQLVVSKLIQLESDAAVPACLGKVTTAAQ